MTARPRARLVVSTLVALATLLVSVIAIGATAANESESITFAASHTGDEWTYDIALDDGWQSRPDDPVQADGPAHVFSFALKPEGVRLADRALHDSARLDVEGYSHWPDGEYGDAEEPRWQAMRRSAWFGEGGTADVVATEWRAGAGKGSSGSSILLLSSSRSVEVEAVQREFDGSGLVPCLGPTLAAGDSVAIGDRVTLWSPCTLGRILRFIAEPAIFKAMSIEDVAALPALRLDSQSGVRVWFNPGIPYPVQVYLPPSDGHGAATLVLSGFHVGSVLYPVEDHGPRDVANDVRMAPPQLWGPEDADSGSPFSASEAFEVARTLEGWSELRDFLERHPDAFAVDGAFLETRVALDLAPGVSQDGGRKLVWWFSLQGGDECLSFSVTRSEPKPTLLDPMPNASDAAESNGGPCTVGAEPALRPTEWPTAASALALWDAYALAPGGTRAWAFQAPTAHAPGRMVAGLPSLVGEEYSSPTGFGMSIVSGDRGLQLEGGLPVGASNTEIAYAYTSSVAGMPLPSQAALPVSSTDETAEDLPLALGAALSPAAAAGVSILSLLAGALYFLWPTLKGGVVGLFSRVQPEAVLGHPHRTSIMLAVESEPGIHYQALLRKMGLGNGTLEHHLNTLVSAGHLRRVRNGGYTCYFVGAPVAGAAALKSEGARRLLQELRLHPGQGLVEAATASGLSPATASHHLARLEEAGLVRSMRDGRSRRLWPTAAASAA